MRYDPKTKEMWIEAAADFGLIRQDTEISTLYIGKNIERGDLWVYSFDIRYNMQNIQAEEGHPEMRSIDGVLYSKDGKELIFCPAKKSGHFSIPEGVEEICGGACFGTDISSVSFPTGLKAIHDHAFARCNVRELFLPDGLERVSAYAFEMCSIRKIRWPKTIRYAGGSIFRADALEYVEAEDLKSAWKLIESTVETGKPLDNQVLKHFVHNQGRPTIFSIAGKQYAVPTQATFNLALVKLFAAFGCKWLSTKILGSAYKYARTPGLKEDTALAAIGINRDDKNASEFVRQHAEEMAARYLADNDIQKIEALAASGLAPGKYLWQMFGATDNESVKAYIMQAIHDAGMEETGIDEAAFEL